MEQGTADVMVSFYNGRMSNFVEQDHLFIVIRMTVTSAEESCSSKCA